VVSLRCTLVYLFGSWTTLVQSATPRRWMAAGERDEELCVQSLSACRRESASADAGKVGDGRVSACSMILESLQLGAAFLAENWTLAYLGAKIAHAARQEAAPKTAARPPRSDLRASVQRVVLSQGDRLFDESKVFVEQFLGLRARRDWRSAIYRRHRKLYGHEDASHIGGVLGEGHSGVLGEGHSGVLGEGHRSGLSR
jgi:hypothetical protein